MYGAFYNNAVHLWWEKIVVSIRRHETCILLQEYVSYPEDELKRLALDVHGTQKTVNQTYCSSMHRTHFVVSAAECIAIISQKKYLQ